MRLFSLAILSAAGIAVAFAQQEPPRVVIITAERVGEVRAMNANEVKFVQDSLTSGRQEIEVAQMALRQAKSPQVKSFAQQVIDDHSLANARLQQIAREYSIPIRDFFPSPTSPAFKSAQERTSMNWSGIDPKTGTGTGRAAGRLARLSGNSFDHEFTKQMVLDHETEVARYQEAQKMVTNTDLKAFVDTSLPTRQEHLAEARALK